MNIVFASLLIAFLPLFSGGQTLQYTNNKIPFDNHSPVIAGSFNDTLHIISKEGRSSIKLYTYNRNMELLGTRLLPAADNKEQFEVLQVIEYTKFYYVIIGNRRRETATILKVYPSGKFEDATLKLQSELKGLFPDHVSISKFQKIEDYFVMSVMYYDSSQQKAYLSVHHLDSLLMKKAEHTVMLMYNPIENQIHEVILPDLRNAYILKSYKGFMEGARQVDIFHYSFVNEVATQVTIAEKGLGFVNPTLHYSPQDSTLLFFSPVKNVGARQLPAAPHKYYRLGFTRILDETSSPRVMEIKKVQNEKSVFIIDKFHDVSINNMNSASRTPNVYYNAQSAIFDSVRGFYDRIGTGRPRYQPNFSEASYKRTDVNLRILWTDQQTGVRNDTLLTTKKTRLKAEYLNSFLFQSGGKYILFYSINYSARGRSISYISTSNGAFSEEEFLPVEHKYDYMLPLARKINDRQLIIPYTYKGLIGFVRLTLQL